MLERSDGQRGKNAQVVPEDNREMTEEEIREIFVKMGLPLDAPAEPQSKIEPVISFEISGDTPRPHGSPRYAELA
jgi:hypothetical protein